MLLRRDMADEPCVGSPWEVLWIPRAAYEEPLCRALARGLDEELLQPGLPVPGIRTEVRQISAQCRICGHRAMSQRIDVSIKRSYPPRAQQLL